MKKYSVINADSGELVGTRSGKADAINLAMRQDFKTNIISPAGSLVWTRPDLPTEKPRRTRQTPDERKAKAKAASTAWRHALQNRQWDDVEIPAEKHCTSCDEVKSSDEFGRTLSLKDGLRQYCKACTNSRHKAWRDAKKTTTAA